MHRMPFNSFPNLSIDAMTRGAVPCTNPCHLGGDPALPDGKFLRQKSAVLPGRKIPKHSFTSGCTLNRSPLTGEKPVVYHSPLCSLPLFAPFTPRTPHTFQKLRDPRARRPISLSLLISSNPHNLQPHQLHHILKPPRLLCCVFGFCLNEGIHQFQSP
ncbi:uncharacterized protein TEOVI_000408200 [Trypanosoma equiperdum]|uniref:T. brucei spp.-specific protein n=2 Tax=Trypanozoon TaxID=39700 RepID=Q38CD8_TRYB2|nr:hypothetical protein Tb10.70.7110 [Trypanosoma brucei brucei TREU927]EAN77532.1 hypothetical protein Tb10.70.7110 [Trypanosoma brucei brucei TREU927]SCU72505.1 hypothetical protein, conserved [Trypanosoma equiperdum]